MGLKIGDKVKSLYTESQVIGIVDNIDIICNTNIYFIKWNDGRYGRYLSDYLVLADEPQLENKVNGMTIKPIECKQEVFTCNHEDKYINSAGGIKFWVCPKCKKDLGNI